MTIAERDALLHAFDSNWIAPFGPALDEFESRLADVSGRPAALATVSGTAALHLALRVLGVVRGDTVIVPTVTFVATANAVRYVGAVPYFVDVEPHTSNLDPTLLESVLDRLARSGRRPAAVLSVDCYGACADHSRLRAICERHGVPYVVDAAESIGATHRGLPSGSFGDLAVFSFNGNKLVTTGGGGALVGSEHFIDRARHLATQARRPGLAYEHDEVGHAYRLSNLSASIGVAQLARLPALIDATRAVHARYCDGLADVAGLRVQPTDIDGRGNAWLTVIHLDDDHPSPLRVAQTLLDDDDIECRPTWRPMHYQPVYDGYEFASTGIADDLFRTGLCLPSGSALSLDDQDRVIRAIRRELQVAAKSPPRPSSSTVAMPPPVPLATERRAS